MQTKELKVGLLTFHRCINYGSYWQARCLVEGLATCGHEAVLLDYFSRRTNLAEWKCALRPALPAHKSDVPLYREKTRRFFRAFEALPLSRKFDLDNPGDMDFYDLVVVGSDEVWNLHHPWYGGCPLFFGERINSPRLVSYAASCGNYPASSGFNPDWSGRLRNFHHISVRDENTQRLVRKATGIEPEVVLDPCLLFLKASREIPRSDVEPPYVAVYGHSFSHQFGSEVKKWARERNLNLISIGYRNDWADEQRIAAAPDEFLTFIARSEAVATNFFHGCVFALVHAKPFVCETSPYRGIKLQDLLQKSGGTKYLVNEDTPSSVYDALLGNALDPDVLRNIDRLRQSSDDFLKRALLQEHIQCT